MNCNFVCHYPCTIRSNDEHNWWSVAINWEEAGENSVCKVCPCNCSCNLHSHIPYRFEGYETYEERTLDDLITKFETVKSDKNAAEITVDKIR